MLTARGVTTAPAANTIEVFVDDKPVQVDPACTVLQVLSLLYAYVRGMSFVTNSVLLVITKICKFILGMYRV